MGNYHENQKGGSYPSEMDYLLLARRLNVSPGGLAELPNIMLQHAGLDFMAEQDAKAGTQPVPKEPEDDRGTPQWHSGQPS